VTRAVYWGWESVEERSGDGAVSSVQRARFGRPVVAFSEAGARQLSSTYWREVERSTRRLVWATDSAGGVSLRAFGRGPALLCFGPPEITATPAVVGCGHAIAGGLLARRPSGEIRFEQRAQDDGVLVVSAISGFHPTLAARPGMPVWTGELYKRVQSRLHVFVGRRYFDCLVQEGGA
jgi:hypothetical protein